MTQPLTHRKANRDDLEDILNLYTDDFLGQAREGLNPLSKESYRTAFDKIDADPNHYLMVVERDHKIIGTCHLTLLPSLTLQGSTRLQIEAVRVHETYRNQKIGAWMMGQVIAYGQRHGATIFQLTTNKKRADAKRFYEHLGFEASHEGMKFYVNE